MATMDQKIENIRIDDLVLWTENPRDRIDPNSSDQDIADLAWNDKSERWKLLKLAKEMHSHYDLSELPTVVYHGEKPLVYDGNRRMILAKIKHDLVTIEGFEKNKLPSIPAIIPCNVCNKDIAIKNVFRKHADSGSWSQLDRDLFVYKFMSEPKSTFLKMDEVTGIISSNPLLNQRFVKDEIFTNEKLKEMGFAFNKDILESKHSQTEAKEILNDISYKVAAKVITTRKNRGKIMEVLDKNSLDIIEANKNKSLAKTIVKVSNNYSQKKKQSARTKKKTQEIFNGILYLKPGKVSDLYRDIVDLNTYYHQKESSCSQYFPSLIRMALRLLCEAAASDSLTDFDNYINSNYTDAKKNLSKDSKTTLSAQNVTEKTILQLLHVGAHNYQAANNLEQTVAVSIILGEMLKLSHGK